MFRAGLLLIIRRFVCFLAQQPPVGQGLLIYEVINVMAAYTAHLNNRLLCRHDIDDVSNDEHIESYVVLAKNETAP